jgi:orotate phosphoribosyltransferase
MADFTQIAQTTAELLLDINAISLQPQKPFEFSSGLKSPIYIDNRLAISFPQVREQVVEFYCQILRKKIGREQVELLSGTSTAAIPWAAFIAQQLDLPMVYVRGKKKGHGKQNQIEGQVKPKQKTVVIEDHISTGGSLIENATAVRDKQAQVDYAVGITTYLFAKASQKFKQHQIKVITLTDYQTIINTAEEKGVLNAREKGLILDWNQNPHHWNPNN